VQFPGYVFMIDCTIEWHEDFSYFGLRVEAPGQETLGFLNFISNEQHAYAKEGQEICTVPTKSTVKVIRETYNALGASVLVDCPS
jgi:hypothetical protein